METARALRRTSAQQIIRICALILIAIIFPACSSLGDSTLPSPERTPSPGITPTPRLLENTPSPTILHTQPKIASPTTILPPSLTPSPTLSPTPTQPACLLEGGKITQHTLRTPISPLPWEYRVYTPPCYDQNPEQRYPLLTLIHGSTFNDDQWDRMGADETADRLIAQGELPPFLILMPRDRIWTDEPSDDPFGQAVVEYLLPWVDENYRTLPDRQYRAIGGLSRGASWAVHLGISNWELFGSIGAHSLPVFVTDPPRLRRWLDEIPPEAMPRFFLDIGEKDYLRDKAEWFETLLTEKNIPHEWYLFTGRHEEAYWESHMEQYLRWYAEFWGRPQ